MPRFIRTYARTDAPTLRGFAERLKTQLEQSIGLDTDCLYHIAGYTWENGSWRPQMWFVTNVAGIDPSTGAYLGPRGWKEPTDEFPKGAIRASYINGLAAGRISFNAISSNLEGLMKAIWEKPQWKFREPHTLDELAAIVDVELRAIGALYRSSTYPAPYVGGDTQILLVPPPPGRVRVWRLKAG